MIFTAYIKDDSKTNVQITETWSPLYRDGHGHKTNFPQCKKNRVGYTIHKQYARWINKRGADEAHFTIYTLLIYLNRVKKKKTSG